MVDGVMVYKRNDWGGRRGGGDFVAGGMWRAMGLVAVVVMAASFVGCVASLPGEAEIQRYRVQYMERAAPELEALRVEREAGRISQAAYDREVEAIGVDAYRRAVDSAYHVHRMKEQERMSLGIPTGGEATGFGPMPHLRGRGGAAVAGLPMPPGAMGEIAGMVELDDDRVLVDPGPPPIDPIPVAPDPLDEWQDEMVLEEGILPGFADPGDGGFLPFD